MLFNKTIHFFQLFGFINIVFLWYLRTEVRNSHRWRLSTKCLDFTGIYFRGNLYLRLPPKSINVYNQFWLKKVNERKNITVSNHYQLIVIRKLTFKSVFFCMDLFLRNRSQFFFARIYFHRRYPKRIFPWIKLPSSDTSVIKLLLYGDDSMDFVTNTLILNASVDFILSNKRFDAPFL